MAQIQLASLVVPGLSSALMGGSMQYALAPRPFPGNPLAPIMGHPLFIGGMAAVASVASQLRRPGLDANLLQGISGSMWSILGWRLSERYIQ
jgi:hypothetical protein